MTGDEMLMFQYDSETKCRVPNKIYPLRPKTLMRTKSKVKTMLISFTDIKGTMYYEYVPPKQSSKHSVSTFSNLYGSTFTKQTKSLARQV
jgi:hypothetical protein